MGREEGRDLTRSGEREAKAEVLVGLPLLIAKEPANFLRWDESDGFKECVENVVHFNMPHSKSERNWYPTQPLQVEMKH